MSASRSRARCLLAWIAVGFVLLVKSNAIAATRSVSLGSSCELGGKSLQTVSNRMIDIRSSFRNGAEELKFTRASTRGKCNRLCCSYEGCDTAMFIGPSAAVWRSRIAQKKLTPGNCALLACNHMCVVDSSLHQGIYISKLVDMPYQALPGEPVGNEMIDQETTVSGSPPTVSQMERETTTSLPTTLAEATTSAPTTLVEATTSVPTTTLAEETTQSPTTTVTPTTAGTTTAAIATAPASREVQETQELVTRDHPMPTTSLGGAPSIAPLVDLATPEGKIQHQLLHSSEVATDMTQSTAASHVSSDDKLPPVDLATVSEEVELPSGEAFQTSTASKSGSVNANSRFSSTPTLVIALAVGLIVFFAVFFLVTRQWVRFAKTKIHKQKEDYLINGMYA